MEAAQQFSVIEQTFDPWVGADGDGQKVLSKLAMRFVHSSQKYWWFVSLLTAFLGFWAGTFLGNHGELAGVRRTNFHASVIFALSFLIVSTAQGLYDRSVQLDFRRSFHRIVSGTLLAALMVPLLLLLSLFVNFGRYANFYGAVGAFIFITAGFFLLDLVYRSQKLVLFFIGPETEIARTIKSHVKIKLHQNILHLNDETVGTPVSFNQALDFILRQGSGDVVFTGSRNEVSASALLAVRALQNGFRVTSETTFFTEVFSRYPVENLSLDHLVAHDFSLPNPLVRMIKRVFDIFLSTLCLIPSSLVSIFIAIAIKLDTPGPLFFVQRRQGQFDVPFRMLKFRTMHWTGQVVDDIGQAAVGDPRITRVGHFLRRTHLDEIPQFVNILLGQMSFVGPRPEIFEIRDRIRELLPAFAIRQIVKPGLTGLAAISQGKTLFSRDELSLKLSYDLYYIKHYNLSLDLWILMQTAFLLLRRNW